MSTSGILRSNEIVFYHPLDDFNEHTIPQLWDGSGTFVPSKIDLGLVASSKSVIWGSPTEHGMRNVDKDSVIRLDDERALLVGVSGSYTYAQVATVSGTTTTFGPVYNAGLNSLSSSEPLGALFSSGVVVLQWRHQGYIRLKVVTVSGDVLSFGTEVKMIFTVPVGDIVSLTPTLGIITYRHESPDLQTRARVIEISGTNITLGTPIQLSSIAGGNCGSSAARLNDSQAIVVYSNASVETQTAVLTVSGINDLTVGPSSILADYGTSNKGFSRVINLSRYEDSNDVAFVWISGGSSIITAVGAVDGTDITIGQEQFLAGAVALLGVAELNPSNYVIAYTFSTLDRLAVIYNVSGLNIYPGTVISSPLLGRPAGGSMDSLRDDLFIVMHPLSDIVVGSIVEKSDMEASDPGQYPIASGNDRVVVSMWEKNLANDTSETILQRDYDIGITSGSISIGPAIWSDSGVLSFLDNISDGNRHLLVFDFEHDVSGIWTLNTSIDGVNWVNRGVQTSGVQNISPTSSSPKILMEDGIADQWIDEVAMWVGDKTTFDKFTTKELQQLYNLGVIFDAPLPKFDSTVFMPLFIRGPELSTSSIDLFTISTGSQLGSFDLFMEGVDSVSASGDLFIPGSLAATVIAPINLFIGGIGSGALAKSMDWLIKTHDYSPQIIGTLVGAASVNIQLWDITDGQNALISVTSSGCYAIGSTGRWGWSTTHLPPNQGNARHYFYMMTSNVSETFDGQFVLDIPEKAKWIYPNNQDEYVKRM